MNYTKLTDDEALEIIKNSDEVTEDEFSQLAEYIEDPANVLYWLDADGDFEQAVRIQGLPIDTPIKVARGLNDTDYDFLAHLVNTAEPREIECASCGMTMYAFENHISNYSETFWIDEYGEHHYDEVEFLGDIAAPPYWQADPDGSHIACTACHYDGIVSRHHRTLQRDAGEYALCGYNGVTGEKTRYSTGGQNGTVIRQDWYWFSMDRGEDWTAGCDIFPCDAEELFRTYTMKTRADVDRLLNDHDWRIVDQSETITFSRTDAHPDSVALQRTDGYGRSKDQRRMKEVVEGWANAPEPHPEFNFRYALDKGSDFWVPQIYAEYVMDAIIEQTLSERHRTAALEDQREMMRNRYDELRHIPKTHD